MLGTSCSSTSTLISDPDAKIYELSDQYVKNNDLGSPPYELPKDRNSIRLTLSRPNTPDEIAYLLFPGKADGDIEIKLRGPKSSTIEIGMGQGYFDEVLRIQRMLFRNELNKVQAAIDNLERTFGETFSYYVLKGIYLGRIGKQKESQRYLLIAAGYNPGSEELSKYLETTTNQLK